MAQHARLKIDAGRRQAMSPAERRRYSCVEWADQEVRKARAKGHEPNSTAVGILHRLGLIDARGRVLYPTSDPGEGNGPSDASDALSVARRYHE